MFRLLSNRFYQQNVTRPINNTRQFTNFFGRSQQNTNQEAGNTSGRYIKSMENRHLYMLIGGGVVAWFIVPGMIDSYKDHKFKKEWSQIKADVKTLKEENILLRKEIDTLKQKS